MFRYRLSLLIILMSVVVLSGCTFNSNEPQNKPITLNVLDQDAERFKLEYLPIIKAAFPKWEIRTTSYAPYLQKIIMGEAGSKDSLLQTMFEETQPDLIIIRDMSAFQMLKHGNYLMPLNAWIGKDKLDISQLDSTLLEPLRGEIGSYYGFASYFSSKVLYYNIDLFEKNGVPIPNEKMSWQDVFELASRIPVANSDGNALYGLYYHSHTDHFFDVIQGIAATLEMNLLDMNQTEKVLTSPAYKAIWDYVLQGYQSGTVYHRTTSGTVESPFTLFAEGRIAMVYSDESMIDRLQNTNIRWSTLPEPVNPNRPEESPSFRYHAITSIYAKSVNSDAAGELLMLLNAKDSEERYGHSGLPLLNSRADGQYPDLNLQAFYSLKPRKESIEAENSFANVQWFLKFTTEAKQKAQQVVEGSLEVEQALNELVTLSELLLTE